MTIGERDVLEFLKYSGLALIVSCERYKGDVTTHRSVLNRVNLSKTNSSRLR